jgi:hypothetical protein
MLPIIRVPEILAKGMESFRKIFRRAHLSQVKQKQGLSSSLLMATNPPAEAAFCAVA